MCMAFAFIISIAVLALSWASDVILVKLGGSAITDKSKYETLRGLSLKRTAEQLALRGSAVKHVLCHGAGSFGHFDARRYSLSTGGQPSSWTEGFAVTHQSVRKLTSLVLRAMRKASKSTDVVHIPLFPFVTTRSRYNLQDDGPLGRESLESLLDAGLTPLFHGDVVLDKGNQNCSIFSGDRILCTIASALKKSGRYRVKAAVFLTDLPGVYDKNPALHRDARLIRHVSVDRRGNLVMPGRGVVDGSSSSKGVVDVTGGIRAKLDAAAQMAKIGVPVYIVQVGTAHALQALRGEVPDIGTAVVANIQ